MKELKAASLSKGVEWSLEVMGVIYVAVAVLFLVNPNWLILVVNKGFARYDWPMVFFPTEKFWFSLAVSVPGTRAYLALAAARKAAAARLYVNVLQVSLILAAVMFAWQFLFYKHAALYALGFLTEVAQGVFYLFLNRKLP
jgi:hypothetical protein